MLHIWLVKVDVINRRNMYISDGTLEATLNNSKTSRSTYSGIESMCQTKVKIYLMRQSL